MEVYLIRHGQSLNNANGENNTDGADAFDRHQDPPLTELGHRQADCLAQHLTGTDYPETAFSHAPFQGQRQNYGITHLYCSAMHRSLQTAQPVAKALCIVPEVWVDIHEHGGIYLDEAGGKRGYPGMTRAEIAAQFADYILPEAISEAGWWNRDFETPDLFQARALNVAAQLREWNQTRANERIALISHGEFLDALIKALLDQLPSDRVYYVHYNTSITRVDLLADGQIRLFYTNRVAHLTNDMISA
ncbi:MAG: histidine phosphatase family protein [Anaerolineae bacterium]|nr:histidine phosphatase family protein [Anaerolineae bacterium]